jgi:acyl carrier protein
MNRSEIDRKLRDAMKRASSQAVDWETVTESATIESLGFDSLSILDLIYDIQQEFGLDFDPVELSGVKTVAGLIDFLASRAAA